MNSVASDNSFAGPPGAWWLRLHRALMPDYNRKAAAYWWTMVGLGATALLHSLGRLAELPAAALLQIAAGACIATLAGFFPVRIPRSKNSFAAGEIFIFLLLLLYGPAAAVLAAAGEALVGSWRTSKRWTSRIASPAMAASAMFAAGMLLQTTLDALQRYGLLNDGWLLLAAMLFALGYFVLNTLFITLVLHLKRGQPLDPAALFGSFGWVGMAYAGSALVAALLYLSFQKSGVGVLIGAIPILAMLLTTLHFFFRQQEADEAIRRSQDAAAEREAEQTARHMRQLQDSERRFHSAFTHASIGMALVSFDGRIVQVNLALRTLLGCDENELVDHRFAELVCADDAGALDAQLARVNGRDIESFTLELRCRHRDGGDVWVALHCSFFAEPGSEAPCLILQAQDISARRHAEARLQHIAFHDSLTGLPNRRRFLEYLAQAIERVREQPQRRFAVLFLDFDRFKLINDSLGHGAGDEFLIQVSARVRENVRPSDLVARLGGDEFAILAEDLGCDQHAIQLAERLQVALKRPVQIGGAELATSASVGITFSSVGYATPDEVLRDADIAMYKAKADGKARYALFDAGLHAQVSNKLRLEGDLRRALADGQLSIAYQPLFNMRDGTLIGFEALARWDHPALGAISPATFIPLAEESGSMLPLTDFMLERACRQLQQWQEHGPESANLRMQINVSGTDIAHSALVQRVSRVLRATRLKPEHLSLELTENILMERLDGAMDVLAALRELGVGLSVDDFGTGYSSLAYLSSLPIDSLKIDASFVRYMRSGSKEAEVVRAIVSLGRALGKSVIAEGIETESQFNQLCRLGCEIGQGHHLSRPLAAERVDALLDRLERPDRLVPMHQSAITLAH